MNEYFLDLRSREKLKELRKEGTLSQEFHRLGCAVDHDQIQGIGLPYMPPSQPGSSLQYALVGFGPG